MYKLVDHINVGQKFPPFRTSEFTEKGPRQGQTLGRLDGWTLKFCSYSSAFACDNI